MEPLAQRLAIAIEILQSSADTIEESRLAEQTGFLAFDARQIADAVLALCEILPPPAKALDLGCGNGAFALLAAAAGYDAYGIDIDPDLTDEAERLHALFVEQDIIDRSTICRFAAGNFFPETVKEQYLRFRDKNKEHVDTMPWQDTADPYVALNITLEDMDAVYTWAWPTQSRFLYNFLEDHAGQDTVFILPAYERYTGEGQENHQPQEQNRLVLDRLASISGKTPLFVGKRVR